jgi:hypothetical protein
MLVQHVSVQLLIFYVIYLKHNQGIKKHAVIIFIRYICYIEDYEIVYSDIL